MSEVMIDIETLSTQPNALILTIGAIKFNRADRTFKDIKEYETLYVKVNKSSLYTFHIDPDTQTWWSMQSKDAQNEVFGGENRVNIKEALLALTKFIKGSRSYWSNSPNFDYVILENAYRQCGLEPPWKFWELMDTRTLYNLAEVSLKAMSTKFPSKVYHHALDDCHKQILTLYQALDILVPISNQIKRRKI